MIDWWIYLTNILEHQLCALDYSLHLEIQQGTKQTKIHLPGAFVLVELIFQYIGIFKIYIIIIIINMQGNYVPIRR